jgi:hypothetical protein
VLSFDSVDPDPEILNPNVGQQNADERLVTVLRPPTPTPPDPPGDDGGQGVTLCHIPPGNPENAHTIRVSPNALPAHLRLHGDTIGPCP